jgi:flavodoxin
MKILLIYSSLTHNTEKVAAAIKEALPEGASFKPISSNPDPEGYDLIFFGFWVRRGRPDPASLRYLQRLKGKKTAFFFTLGAYPDSPHALKVIERTISLLEENENLILGHFHSHGKVDPALIERSLQKFSPESPHGAMTPEREARLREAARHPNEEDFRKAKDFALLVLKKVA